MANVTFLARADWGGGPLRAGYTVPKAQFVRLVSHHTVGAARDYDHDGTVNGDLDDAVAFMRWLQGARPDLGPEVPYSFCIFKGADANSCIVAEGRGETQTGAHTPGYNSKAWGVAWVGDYTSQAPTPGMIAGFRWIGARLADPEHALPALGHRQVYPTACPGDSAFPLPPAMQPPYDLSPIDPDPDLEVDDVFLTVFADDPSSWWLVSRDNNAPAGKVGFRRHIPSPEVLNTLIAQGFKTNDHPIPGMVFYQERPW